MTAAGYAFLGLTAIVATIVAILVFAVLKFAAAALCFLGLIAAQ